MSGYREKYPDDSAPTGSGRIRSFESLEPGGRAEGDRWTTVTPWRVEVLDGWARAEPRIAEMVVRLLSADKSVRELLFEAVQRLAVKERIRLLTRLLFLHQPDAAARSMDPLITLYALRNDLAHNYTFPVQPLDEHITLMVGKGYGHGALKRVTFDKMRNAVLEAEPLVAWLGTIRQQVEG